MDKKSTVAVLDASDFGEGKDVSDFIESGGQIEDCAISPVQWVETNESPYSMEPYDGVLKAYDWLIEDFMYSSIVTIAGPRGIGKTTMLLNLFSVAAGLFEVDQIRCVEWRPVVIISEDTDQVRRILYGIQQQHDLTPQQIDERIKIASARRASKSDMEMLEKQVRKLVRKVGDQEVYPIIIFDTYAANFDLYSENDNQAISDFVSALKQIFKSYPQVITTHTSKSDRFLEPEMQTARGGGALEGDTQGAFVVGRMANDDVFITPTKRRDTGAIPEIGISLSSNEIFVKDRWGNDQSIRYHTGRLYVTSREQRDEISEATKTSEQLRTINEIKDEIRPYLNDGPVSTRKAQQIVRDAGIKAQNVVINEALASLSRSIEYQKQTEGY